MHENRSVVYRPGVPKAIAAAMAFVVLTVVSTWPLASNLSEHIRGYNDPYLFAWMLTWVSKTIYIDPGTLFDTNVFWPYGNTLAWSEPLVFPAATVGAPTLALTQNPIFTYNVTQLVFQALSGWCAWYATRRLTGSDAGAVLAGIVFALSPFKTGYYQYLNIHLSFAVPLAIMFWYQFLVDLRPRHLILTAFAVWIQALSIWYGAIPLALVLAIMTLCFVLMRPGEWLFKFITLSAIAAVVVGIATLPVASPYFQTRDELGFVRSLAEINKFRADILSFFDAGRWHYFHQWIDSGREPGIMAGVTTYLLALIAVVAGFRHYLVAATQLPRTRWSLALLGILALTLLIAALTTAAGGKEFAVNAYELVVVVLIISVGLMLCEGYHFWHSSAPDRALAKGPLLLMLGLLTFISVGLCLGPNIHIGDNLVDKSPYLWLYDAVPGFKGLRIAFRLAFVFLFFAGLLAAITLAAWSRRHPGPLRHIVWIAPVLVYVEFAHKPLEFMIVDWDNPPPAYAWLKQQPDSDGLLELPTFNEKIDSLYSFWSLHHERPLVNGVSGFPSPIITGLAPLVRTLPQRRDLSLLQEVDRLGYLKVNLGWIKDRAIRRSWLKLSRDPPEGLEFVDRFDDALIFKVGQTRTPGSRWRKFIAARSVEPGDSYDVDIEVPNLDSSVQQHVEINVNGEKAGRRRLKPGVNRVSIDLPQSLPESIPVSLNLQQSYRVPPTTDSRYWIGSTNTNINADLIVTSGHAEAGDVATILVNGVNVSPRQTGYNVVLIDPKTGKVLARHGFDIAKRPASKKHLVKVFDTVAAGTVVVAALRRRGTAAVDTDVADAFRSIGAAYTIDGNRSHLIIGVKGAPVGSAIEMIGDDAVSATVGIDRRNMTMIVSPVQSK